MELRERRLAQILRDFMEAFVLARTLGEDLRAGRLSFRTVTRLVGDAEDSALFRLKEETHALFRLDAARPRTEVQAEELFDLAVGALFHETMKFREGFYLTDSYGPRLSRMMAEGSAKGPLADAFWRVVEAGRRRMLESEVEWRVVPRDAGSALIVLRQLAASGWSRGASSRTRPRGAGSTCRSRSCSPTSTARRRAAISSRSTA
jgi:hypothetical protein